MTISKSIPTAGESNSKEGTVGSKGMSSTVPLGQADSPILDADPAAKPKAGRDRIDIFASANIDVFGTLLPSGFTGTSIGSGDIDAISEILSEYSFPSLNLVLSAASRLIKYGGVMRLGALLNELELRVKISPIGANGDLIKHEQPDTLVKILMIEPTGTQVQEIIEEGQGRTLFTGPIHLPQAGPKGKLVGGKPSIRYEPFVNKSKFVLLEKSSIAGPQECAWYLKSTGAKPKEGVHNSLAFLQVNREVKELDVELTLSTDWHSWVARQVEVFQFRLPVLHPKVPKTPNLIDFTDLNKVPTVIPRSDIKTLLRVTDTEFEELVNSGDLRSFGADKGYVSKGSLRKLLGV